MSQATRQNSGRGAGGRAGAQGRPGPGPGRRTWLTFLLILLANFLVIRLLFPHPAAGKVPYTLFKQEVAKRNVEQIYSRGESLTGRFRSPVTSPSSRDTTARAAQRSFRDFETTLPAFVDPGLEALLIDMNAKQTERGMVITIGDVLELMDREAEHFTCPVRDHKVFYRMLRDSLYARQLRIFRPQSPSHRAAETPWRWR